MRHPEVTATRRRLAVALERLDLHDAYLAAGQEGKARNELAVAAIALDDAAQHARNALPARHASTSQENAA